MDIGVCLTTKLGASLRELMERASLEEMGRLFEKLMWTILQWQILFTMGLNCCIYYFDLNDLWEFYEENGGGVAAPVFVAVGHQLIYFDDWNSAYIDVSKMRMPFWKYWSLEYIDKKDVFGVIRKVCVAAFSVFVCGKDPF